MPFPSAHCGEVLPPSGSINTCSLNTYCVSGPSSSVVTQCGEQQSLGPCCQGSPGQDTKPERQTHLGSPACAHLCHLGNCSSSQPASLVFNREKSTCFCRWLCGLNERSHGKGFQCWVYSLAHQVLGERLPGAPRRKHTGPLLSRGSVPAST